MHYFNNIFSKITKRWELSTPSILLTPDFGNLKLRDMPKSRIFKRIMTKSKFKKSVMTLFQ